MKRCTPRKLVRRHVGGRNVTTRKLNQALAAVQQQGWMPAYAPRSHDADRELPLVRRDHPLAPFVTKVCDAYQSADPPAAAAVSIQDLLNAMGWDSLTEACTRRLAKHGMLIADADTDHLQLLGSTPSLALLINRLRHRPYPRGLDRRTIVQAVLGLTSRPERLRVEAILVVAEELERFGINAEGLLDETRRSPLRSRWLLADKLAPVTEGGGHVER